MPLRVRVTTSGGLAAFPGLEGVRTVDAGALPAGERERLECLVREAGFFALPRRIPAPAGAADFQSHDIEIDDGPRHHHVTVAEPVADPALRALVEALRRLAVPER